MTLIPRTKPIRITATVVGLLTAAVAALFLYMAFQYPFVSSQFNLKFPSWVPNWGGLHDNIRKWIMESGQVIVGPQYLANMIRDLFKTGDTVIGVMVLMFSVVFPMLKISATVLLFAAQKWIADNYRVAGAHILGFLAKWSMGDIFIVALVIVLVKAEGFNYTFKAELGVLCYAGSAIMASISASFVRFTTGPLEEEPVTVQDPD